mgnify:FL=1
MYAQGSKFFHLLSDTEVLAVMFALYGHDLIEDGRKTYNDILSKVNKLLLPTYGEVYCEAIVDIIYCVTDEKGKNRSERKNEKFYRELDQNKLAVFVKLSDMAANKLYSKLSGSSMYDKYNKEFPKFKDNVKNHYIVDGVKALNSCP